MVQGVGRGVFCDGSVCSSNRVEWLFVEGLRPDKNWFMLSLKFPRQKIVKGDFLNRDGDFTAYALEVGGNRNRSIFD
jgi:hypothetical protein